MTEAHVRRVLSDLHRMTGGAAIGSSRVREYLDRWVKAKGGSISVGTRASYAGTAKDFCDYLGDRSEIEMLYVTKADITGFRDRYASTRATATANKAL